MELAFAAMVALNLLFGAIFSSPPSTQNVVEMGGPGSGDPLTDPWKGK